MSAESASKPAVGDGGGAAKGTQITVDLAHPHTSLDSSAVVMGAMAVASDVDAASSSTSTSYPYPGGFGAGGTLTTDTLVPTRSVDPSRITVTPTTELPPPVDHNPTLNDPPLAVTDDGNGPNAVGDPTPPIVESPGKTAGPTIPKTVNDPSTSTFRFQNTSSYTTTSSSPSAGITIPPYTNYTYPIWNDTDLSIPDTAIPTGVFTVNSSVTSNETLTMTTDENGSVLPMCGPTLAGMARTVYSIVYTDTITWYGSPADYTAPYAPITTPSVCMPAKSPLRLTYSYCLSTGTGSLYVTCEATTRTIYPTTFAFGEATITPTVVFLTTDKNPAVVYTTIKTPGYGGNHPGTHAEVSHTSVNGNGGAAGGVPPNSQAINDPGKTPVTVAVQPTAVVINGHTFIDDPVRKTQTVVVGGQTFIINPSQVIGGGASVDRPTVTGGVFVPTPTSTNIAGLPVTVSSSVAVVGGKTFTIGPSPTTTVIGGQTVSIGPGGVAIASRTIPVSVFPSPTEVVIAGGNLITAIGQSVVVIHGTTITYGPEDPLLTIVGGDTITVGPFGVVVHGTTLGGPNANPTETQYEIVGGATITQIGPSVVVIGGSTYTVGPGAGSRTTVFNGQTVTIGPKGVSLSTYSIAYPFGPTTTITPGATGVLSTAKPTTSKDAGPLLRPDWTWVSFISCIAIGVMGFAI